jgi:hypothetical protein
MAEKYASEDSFASWMLCIWWIIVYGFLRTLVVYPPIRAHNGNNEYKKISEQSVPLGVRACDPVLSSARLHVWHQVATYSMKHRHPLRADDKSVHLHMV